MDAFVTTHDDGFQMESTMEFTSQHALAASCYVIIGVSLIVWRAIAGNFVAVAATQ